MFELNVFSEGDLCQDSYLNFCGPRFSTFDSVTDRISLIDESIRRLNIERDWLVKHGSKLVQRTSYADIKF